MRQIQTDWWVYLHVFCIFWSCICLWFVVTFVAVVWYICRCFLVICSEMLNLFSFYFFILKSIRLAQNKGIFVRSTGESWKGQGVRWYVPLVFSTVIWSSQEDTRTPKLIEREDGRSNQSPGMFWFRNVGVTLTANDSPSGMLVPGLVLWGSLSDPVFADCVSTQC